MVIDIHDDNGVINWQELLKNDPKIVKVIHKASEGVGAPDKMFTKNINDVVKIGLRWSAYHFATWNKTDEVADALEEASDFLKRLATVPKPTEKVYLDVETNKTKILLSPPEVETYILTFEQAMLKAGYQTGIYASPGFINSFLPRKHKIGHLGLWQADYRRVPIVANGFKNYELLQYTDQGIIRGIKTRVDLNREAA